MSAAPQWEQWEDERPRSRLSEAEQGDSLFSTKQGRRLVVAILLGFMAYAGLWLKGAHFLAAGFAPAMLLIALYLYRYHRTLFISFNWWVWCLTPLARRMIEIKSGFMITSPILLAPYLATLPTLYTLFLHAPKLLRRKLFPFAMILSALCFAYIVGIVSTGIAAASYALLVWLIPVLLGFHMAAEWETYPAMRIVMRKTLVWSVLVMGVYGVFQFVRPLPWDLFWIWATNMLVVGRPFPMQFRVFSTLNSPAPFAVVMMASLIVVLSQRTKLGWLAMAFGATSLLLTTVRTAWLGFAIGFLVFAWYVPFRSISRIVLPLLSLGIVVGVLTMFTPLGDTIITRFQSFSTLHDDVSLNERKKLYSSLTDRILNNPIGEGMGGTGAAATMSQGTAMQSIDSGLLDIVFSLGWFGALVYVVGVIGFVAFALRVRDVRDDYFDLSLRAGALATLSILPSFNSLTGVHGIVFWGFLGLCIGRKLWVENWYEEQEKQARVLAIQAVLAEHAGAA